MDPDELLNDELDEKDLLLDEDPDEGEDETEDLADFGFHEEGAEPETDF